jgi:hypothetical protein
MPVHVVMPARPAHYAGTLVRTCTRCPWVESRPRAERDELDRLAQEHIDNPDGDQPDGGDRPP